MKPLKNKSLTRKLGMAALTSAFAMSALPIAQANAGVGLTAPDHHNEAKKCNPCKGKGCDMKEMKAMDHMKKCNPCAAKAKKMAKKNKCNPCAAKNKCKAKHKCNPCKAKGC